MNKIKFYKQLLDLIKEKDETFYDSIDFKNAIFENITLKEKFELFNEQFLTNFLIFKSITEKDIDFIFSFDKYDKKAIFDQISNLDKNYSYKKLLLQKENMSEKKFIKFLIQTNNYEKYLKENNMGEFDNNELISEMYSNKIIKKYPKFILNSKEFIKNIDKNLLKNIIYNEKLSPELLNKLYFENYDIISDNSSIEESLIEKQELTERIVNFYLDNKENFDKGIINYINLKYSKLSNKEIEVEINKAIDEKKEHNIITIMENQLIHKKHLAILRNNYNLNELEEYHKSLAINKKIEKSLILSNLRFLPLNKLEKNHSFTNNEINKIFKERHNIKYNTDFYKNGFTNILLNSKNLDDNKEFLNYIDKEEYFKNINIEDEESKILINNIKNNDFKISDLPKLLNENVINKCSIKEKVEVLKNVFNNTKKGERHKFKRLIILNYLKDLNKVEPKVEENIDTKTLNSISDIYLN